MKIYIKIADVPTHIYQITGRHVTRQTIYKWVKKGKRLPPPYDLPVKLKTEKVLGQHYTTKEDLNIFLSRVSL